MIRRIALGLCAAAFTAAGGAAQVGSELKGYEKKFSPSDDATRRINRMKDGELVVNGSEKAANLKALDEIAQSIVLKVTHEKYYLTDESPNLKTRAPDAQLDNIFTELNRYVLVPAADSKFTVDQVAYLREFGVALDRWVVNVLKMNAPPIIRVNAARVLASAARSGAPAHAKTITALLSNQLLTVKKDGKDVPADTPPEVLLWTYRAAEGLLAAYDPNLYGRPDARRHAIPEADLVALVAALEDHIVKRPPVAGKVYLPPPPPAKNIAVDPNNPTPADPKPVAKLETKDPTALAPEQAAVVEYFRRQAVRALGKVRFDTVGGKTTGPGRTDLPERRPLVALAKVAVGDASIDPPPSPQESAEAVVGLCNMAPGPKVNADELAQCVAAGLVAFARARTAQPPRQDGDPAPPVPWRLYAAKLSVALADWKKLAGQNPKLLSAGQLVGSLADVATAEVLTPIERSAVGGASAINVERLIAWAGENPPKDPGRSLYVDSPAYKLNPKAAGR